jgi:hypothetical protein
MIVDGKSYATMDGEIVYMWSDDDHTKTGEPYAVWEIERAAKLMNRQYAHDWRLVMGDRKYRRLNGRWLCVN